MCGTCRRQKRKCDKSLPICGLYARHDKACEYDGEAKGFKDDSPNVAEFEELKRKVVALERLLEDGRSNDGARAGTSSSSAHAEVSASENGTTPTSKKTSAAGIVTGKHDSSLGNGTARPSSHGLSPTYGSQRSAMTSHNFPAIFFLDAEIFQYHAFDNYRPAIPTPNTRVPPAYLASLGSTIELREGVEQYFATVHTYFSVISKIRLHQHQANPAHELGTDIALLSWQ